MRPLSEYQKVRRVIGWLLRNRRFQADRPYLQSREFLNLGCGPFAAPGFVNLDYRWAPGVDLVWDLRHPLPFPNERFGGIFSEHCIEHIDGGTLQSLFSELFRILRPGGRIRLVVPSLEIHARAYVAALEQGLRDGTDGEDDAAALAINRVFYEGHGTMRSTHWTGDGHHFVHDYASLARCLRASGFVQVTRESFGQGAEPRLLIEQESRRVESLYVEGLKPPPPARP